MKNILLFLIISTHISYAQIKHITFEEAQNPYFAKEIKKHTKISSYTSSSELTFNIGDTLTIGSPLPKNKRMKKKLMYGDTFTNIIVGKAKKNKNSENYEYLSFKNAGNKVVIKSIYVTHQKYTGYKFWKNRKEMPLEINLLVKNPDGGLGSNSLSKTILNNSIRTVIDLEKALNDGELYKGTIKKILTREEAIKKLKEYKDLLDLEMISQEEYDNYKKDLSPIINKNE